MKQEKGTSDSESNDVRTLSANSNRARERAQEHNEAGSNSSQHRFFSEPRQTEEKIKAFLTATAMATLTAAAIHICRKYRGMD